MALKPSSYANSKKPGGSISPSLKTKNFFTRYVDILNYDSNESAAAASTATDSVSDSDFILHFSLH